MADFTQAIRTRYPRARRPDGYFYPPKKARQKVTRGSSSSVRLRRSRWTRLGRSPASCATPARANRSLTIAWESPQDWDMAPRQTDSQGRYHILRGEDEPSIVIYSDQYHTDRYLIVVRRLTARRDSETSSPTSTSRVAWSSMGGCSRPGPIGPSSRHRARVATIRCPVPCWRAMCSTFLFPAIPPCAVRRPGCTSKVFRPARRITTVLSRSAETGGSASPSRQVRESSWSRHLRDYPCSPKCRSGRRAKDSTAYSPTWN